MNRRSFLSSMFAATAGGLLTPKISYFFAPKGGWSPPKYPKEFTGVIHPAYTNLVFGAYADYSSHVWDNKGRHYNLLKMDDLVSAGNSSDAFVRSLALFKAEKLPPSGYMSRLSR